MKKPTKIDDCNAFLEGRAAREQGKTGAACPYSARSTSGNVKRWRRCWMDGWFEAEGELVT